MSRAAKETAYYLNGKVPVVALITRGVRFPSGTWIRVADPRVLPRHVEEMVADMFPALKGKVIAFATLMSESDVKAYEEAVPE
jgi:hypothetical protein